jgi:hypothetical protein
MLTFHGDPSIKDKYVRRLKAHHRADEIIKGTYWEDERGCCVGCTLHSDSHAAYETELGLPEWYAWLIDAIFEGLPSGKAQDFAVASLGQIPVGVDIDSVRGPFLRFLTEESGDCCLDAEMSASPSMAARSAARSAARAAWAAAARAAGAEATAEAAAAQAERAAWAEAAEAAARAAWAEAEAARAAARAAWAEAEAARAAARAAWAQSWAAAWERYATKLIELVAHSQRSCPSGAIREGGRNDD